LSELALAPGTSTEPSVPEPDPRIVYSDLCCTLTFDCVTVEVRIYRPEHDSKWALEVVNEAGNVTLWDNLFDTDQEALSAFEETVIDEGIETSLNDGDVETLH
jgi:uncharacterized protein